MSRSLMPFGGNLTGSIDEFRREMNNLMQSFFAPQSPGEMADVLMPKMNLAETSDHYEIDADLPGVKPEELSIEIKGHELWITGERQQEKEEAGKRFHRIEHRYGKFQRVIPLEYAVMEDQVEAEYKDGVLRIVLPKAEEAMVKKISVKS